MSIRECGRSRSAEGKGTGTASPFCRRRHWTTCNDISETSGRSMKKISGTEADMVNFRERSHGNTQGRSGRGGGNGGSLLTGHLRTPPTGALTATICPKRYSSKPPEK